MFNTIVWATDGSDHADRALRYAKELLAPGGKIIAGHGGETFVGHHVNSLYVYADEEEMQAKVKRQVEDLVADGIDATAKIVTGPAPGVAHMMGDIARENEADLIVVGTRGHTPLAGLMLGSVTQRLLHIAPCPVLAVPDVRTAAERQPAESAHATA